MKKNGFTLIEVVIAMFILAFLSLFTVQAIQRALRDKTKVQKDIDKKATLRDALRVMERDVNLAFNYRDVYATLYNQAQDERKKVAMQPKTTANPGTGSGGVANPGSAPAPVNPNIPGQPIDETKYAHKPEDKIKTQFIGESEAMNFTSLSNVRMMEGTMISSQAEIGYHLKSCRRRSTQQASSNCLWRRVSNFLHEDITRNGDETVLLENVTAFKLRYLGPGKPDEWLDSWMSNERGDDNTKGKFPYAVEITLEVQDSDRDAKDKKLRMTTVAAIRNPNNPPKNEPAKDANGQPIQNPGQPTQPTNGAAPPTK